MSTLCGKSHLGRSISSCKYSFVKYKFAAEHRRGKKPVKELEVCFRPPPHAVTILNTRSKIFVHVIYSSNIIYPPKIEII